MRQRGGPQVIPRPDQSRPGRPAPWHQIPTDAVRGLSPEQVRGAYPLERIGRPSPVEIDGASPSAVLVPLYEDETGLNVVLTRRSWNLRTHRGEVSFPGGRTDEGESHVEAALRESREEIGLDADSVEVLGELDHLTTVTRRAYVVPVIGLLPEKPHVDLNPGEVDEALFVPLSELVLPEVFREERWGFAGSDRPIYFFELFGDTVWGATAALLRQFLSVMLAVDPGSDVDLDPGRGPLAGFNLTWGQEQGLV